MFGLLARAFIRGLPQHISQSQLHKRYQSSKPSKTTNNGIKKPRQKQSDITTTQETQLKETPTQKAFRLMEQNAKYNQIVVPDANGNPRYITAKPERFGQ